MHFDLRYQNLEKVVKVPEKTITDEHLRFIAKLAIKHSIRDSLCNPDSSYNDIDICLDLSDASKKIKILKIYSKILTEGHFRKN